VVSERASLTSGYTTTPVVEENPGANWKNMTDHNRVSETNSTKAVTRKNNIFQNCCHLSLASPAKKAICNELNVAHSSNTDVSRQTTKHCEPVARLIQQQCRESVEVMVYRVKGDGNCLFRCLSLGITNSEDYHVEFRHMITLHLLAKWHGNENSEMEI